jgi:hypothetical protein
MNAFEDALRSVLRHPGDLASRLAYASVLAMSRLASSSAWNASLPARHAMATTRLGCGTGGSHCSKPTANSGLLR